MSVEFEVNISSESIIQWNMAETHKLKSIRLTN